MRTPRSGAFFLPLAELWYNSGYHSTIKTSSFVANHGREPRHWAIQATSTCRIPMLKEWLEERKLMQRVLSQHLHRAREVMKHQTDKKRTDINFVIGDRVFVKLQPYAQTFVHKRAEHKLAFKYFGPSKLFKR